LSDKQKVRFDLWDAKSGERVCVAIANDTVYHGYVGNPRVIDAKQLRYLFGANNSKRSVLFWMYDCCNTSNFVNKKMLLDLPMHRNTLNIALNGLIADNQIKTATMINDRGIQHGYMINPRLFRKSINLENRADLMSDYEKEDVKIFTKVKVI